MDLLAFERKLDSTIMRKRLDIQESLKRPVKVKRKLRVFISNQYFPEKPDPEGKPDGGTKVQLLTSYNVLFCLYVQNIKADKSTSQKYLVIIMCFLVIK